MTNTLRLDIGGVRLELSLPTPSLVPLLQTRYRAFLSEEPPAWRVALALEPSLTPGAAWVHHEGPRTHFRVDAHEGWIDLAAQCAEVSAPSAALAHSALERTMAYICMQALPRYHEALLLHAAGVVVHQDGHVFFGASGKGKSTIARLARGRAEVLTDENVIVRLGAAGPELLSTPFWGLSTPASEIQQLERRTFPLRALYSLNHAPTFTLTLLTPARAVMELLTSEKVATERTSSATAWLAVAERLVAQVPVYHLGFRPTPDLWDFLALTPIGSYQR